MTEAVVHSTTDKPASKPKRVLILGTCLLWDEDDFVYHCGDEVGFRTFKTGALMYAVQPASELVDKVVKYVPSKMHTAQFDLIGTDERPFVSYTPTVYLDGVARLLLQKATSESVVVHALEYKLNYKQTAIINLKALNCAPTMPFSTSLCRQLRVVEPAYPSIEGNRKKART